MASVLRPDFRKANQLVTPTVAKISGPFQGGRYLNAAAGLSALSGVQLAVLRSIASRFDVHNIASASWYMSAAQIHEDTHFGERTVEDALAYLVAEGYLTKRRQRRGGEQGANIYSLTKDTIKRMTEWAEGKRTPLKETPRPRQPRSRKPARKPSETAAAAVSETAAAAVSVANQTAAAADNLLLHENPPSNSPIIPPPPTRRLLAEAEKIVSFLFLSNLQEFRCTKAVSRAGVKAVELYGIEALRRFETEVIDKSKRLPLTFEPVAFFDACRSAAQGRDYFAPPERLPWEA